ncbi:PQ-loop domain-containing transporter [Mycoplasmopsis verecunda]|uniref:MtN3 and saliva related transmembrane protein n=1 Tax=Mycoplasmopsis verecunda TaxID=171291 RepID=A0A1T4LTV6_9BACT|nr:PQ-loop domain-containing transporter [Mycoplasmopsis verecunda]WPB54558.1 PQ-loop domain-containing transporter [Mycoplasmopsis verecunda]SJZ58087.1 MtN3 and saliva related transmembrane protein [Mycoplasmopsis verecunda]
MQNLIKLFNKAPENEVVTGGMLPTPVDTAFTVFLWLSVVFIISLSLPQLFKLIKDRKTGDVSFTSFWIFHIGILLWVIWGATNKLNHGMLNVMVADGIALYVNGVMTGLLYLHKKEFSKQKKLYGYLGVLATWIIGTLFIVFYGVDYNSGPEAVLFKVPDTLSTIMGFLFPAATTLAFTPQLIRSFKTKQWQGVTYWMYVLYVINNIVWIIWWILGLVQQSYQPEPNYGSIIAGLIWQIISLALFSIQLGFTLHDKYLLSKGIDRSVQTGK